MKKGVSPVVSVVLLIAIAVVAAAAVWFWVAPMMTSTQTSDVVGKYQVTITSCRPSSTAGNVVVSVRNIGTSTTPASAGEVVVYNIQGVKQGNMSLASMAAGTFNQSITVANMTPSSSLSGTLYIEDNNFAKTTFGC